METCMHNIKLTQTCVICCRYAQTTEVSLAAPTLSRDNPHLPLAIWFATGVHECFVSKEDCERAVRLAYSNESPDSRHARIYYKPLFVMEPRC